MPYSDYFFCWPFPVHKPLYDWRLVIDELEAEGRRQKSNRKFIL